MTVDSILIYLSAITYEEENYFGFSAQPKNFLS